MTENKSKSPLKNYTTKESNTSVNTVYGRRWRVLQITHFAGM
jgi:hypothetical protein